MTVSRLEEIIHVVVAKPIAWAIFGVWRAGKWVGRGAVKVRGWSRSGWTEFRQKKEASRSATM